METTTSKDRDKLANGITAISSRFLDVLRTPREPGSQSPSDEAQQYRDLIDALGVAVYTTDAEGVITYYNEAAAELWGRRPDVGKDLWCGSWKIYHLDGITIMPHDECPMAICLKEDRPVRGREAIAERPDGSRVYFRPFPTPLHDESGKLVGAINVLVDVSGGKEAEMAAVRLAAIVESSDDAIVSKNLDGIVLSWNSAAERIFGYTAEEMTGQSIRKIIPPDRQAEEDEVLARIRRGERVDHFATIRRKKDGTEFPISLTVSPVKDRTGRIIGASKVARDISERKQAESLLRYQKEALEMVTRQAPLGETLDFLARAVQAHSRSGMKVAIHMVNPEGTHFVSAAAPSLPEKYAKATEGLEVASRAGPCCDAILNRGTVHTADVENDPRWPQFAEFAIPCGIRAGWSTPVFSSAGAVLGTVACYYSVPREASPEDQRLIEIVTRTVSLAIERNQTETALRESEERFRAMTNAVPAIVWTAAPDGEITYANERWFEFTGITPDENRRGWPELVLHPDDYERCMEAWSRSLRDGTDYEIEVRNRRHDGEYRWFLTRATPLRDASGRTTAWYGASSDVTERKLAEAAAREAVERSVALKDEFLGLVSHELRTPITTILGNAMLLQRRGDKLPDDSKRQAFGDVVTESERLQRIIENLLLLSRVSVNEHVDTEPLRLRPVISQAVEVLQRRNPRRVVEVSYEAEMPIVRGQPEFVSLVIDNLVTNADKYSPIEAPIEIVVHANGGDEVEVCVRDYGIGFDESDGEEIFTPFYRSPRARSQAKGLGLGLAVCKRVMEAQGGSIRAVARPDGSDFIFTLKRYRDDPD